MSQVRKGKPRSPHLRFARPAPFKRPLCLRGQLRNIMLSLKVSGAFLKNSRLAWSFEKLIRQAARYAERYAA